MSQEDLQTQVENLRIAVESNRVIGMAMGILIERMRITPDAAFAVLQARSQATGRKVRDLAVDLVQTGDVPGLPAQGGLA